MIEKEKRHEQFRFLLDALPMSQGGIAELMYHRDTKKTRDYVSRKYTGKVTVTQSDVTLLYLVYKMHCAGDDVKKTFSEMSKAGFVVQTPANKSPPVKK